jgi:hypothetical protein
MTTISDIVIEGRWAWRQGYCDVYQGLWNNGGTIVNVVLKSSKMSSSSKEEAENIVKVLSDPASTFQIDFDALDSISRNRPSSGGS